MFVIDGDYEPPCHEDPDLFFTKVKSKVERAQRLCGDCRIRLICLEKALEFEQLSGERLHGVHGGLTPEQRANTKLTRIA